jgi:thiol:disulfide interchange protein DsbD
LSAVRLLASTFFLGLAFYLVAGLFGTPLGSLDAFLPPANASRTVAQSSGQEAWINSYEKALEQARQTHKAVFVNFTGVTCTNCRWMESNMFTDQEIKDKLGSFILAELYTDRQTPEDEHNSKLQETQFSTVALPLYVIVDADGHLLAQFAGLTRDKNEFISFLKTGADRFSQTLSRN